MPSAAESETVLGKDNLVMKYGQPLLSLINYFCGQIIKKIIKSLPEQLYSNQ